MSKLMTLVAIAASATFSAFAAALNLAGVDRTVTDVADLASYDEGVTNTSSTFAMLTFDISDEQTYAGVIGGKLKLVKSGTGTLTLDKADRTYTGGTQISAGKLKLALDNPKALGSGDITVVDGAAIDLYGCLKSSNTGFPANLYAEGTGTDGTGAILNTGYNHVNPAVQKLYLTGDLLVNRAKRIDFGAIYMQGHDLRLIGSGESAVTTVNNSQGGDLFIDAGKYTLFGNNASSVPVLQSMSSKPLRCVRGARPTIVAITAAIATVAIFCASDGLPEESGRCLDQTGGRRRGGTFGTRVRL